MRKLTRSWKIKLGGGGLVLFSVLITIWLGLRSASPKPPSGSESAVLVIFSAALQIAGGATFASVGRADPGHAQSAVRRLIRVGTRAKESEGLVQHAIEFGNSTAQKRALGQVSVSLSVIQEDAMDAIADWNYFHTEALKELVEGTSEGESS